MRTNRFLRIGWLLLFGGALALAAPGAVYVATNAVPGAPYDCWTNAFTNIQDALAYLGDVSVSNFRIKSG